MTSSAEQSARRPDGAATAPAAPRRPRSARRLFCLVLLILEAFVGLFLALVLAGLALTSSPVAWVIGALVGGGALLGAALVRNRVGIFLGWAVQIALIATGYWIGDMYVLGLIFLALWVASLRLGRRIDVEREQRYHLEIAHWRQHTGADRGDEPSH
ncbi:MAG: DUF4233 domain-containing protein [Bowdeniella nasicola]|nr:DUF4233 domain-containing protein [Bowdeniella nasicola]